MKEDGSWKVGFWIMTVLCGVWLVALTQGVVANDRIRSSEDVRIETEMKELSEKFYERLEMFSQKNDSDHAMMVKSLTRIETKLNMEARS